MPISFHYDPEKDALFCIAEGWVVLEDFQNMMLEIIGSGEFSPDVRTLWDLRKLDLSSLTKELADQLIALRANSPQRGATRIAIIADVNHSFAMSRMYEMLSSDLPQEIMVFRDFAAGGEWLLSSE